MDNKKNIDNSKQNNSKVIRINDDIKSQNFIHVKKLKIIFIVVILIFAILIGRIGYLQFIQGSYLKELAYQQQAINQIISPKRGSIYDSTGKVLATSASVDTITINPNKIKDSKDDAEKTKQLKEKVAKAFSDIFELDYNETLEKLNSTAQVETIVKKVEQDKVDKLKSWMEENDISVGINIDEDTKRYYPYSTVLSHVLGSCGSDNQGLSGIEFKWDSVLSGTPGKIVSSKSASQEEIPNTEETYIPAENGSDLTLTIDLNIQTIVEKYLKQAVENNICENGGNCIVMNPKTGDILAMASYPNYDLNQPFTPNEYVAKTYDSLSSEEKSQAIYKMWSNKSVSELYEPGSVFKVITASAALEEDITDTDISGDFNCAGYETVTGTPIKCWRDYNPHGSQTLRQALENSCNPAFIQLGTRIGTSTLYKYYKAFGLFDKTGISLPGEADSLFIEEKSVKPIERATMSFGQRFSITPLQMITAVSAIANDGILMKPRIVKEITNTDTGSVTTVDPEEVRQVISSETASKVKSMMESVVEDGTGYRGAVTGYTVGGKTGTSEPISGREETDGYVASYIAISPVEDTQIVLLLTLYKPPKDNHQGGQLAGPVVSQMLTEILPYLGIPSSTESTDDTDLITVPEIRNKTITEAEKILKEAGFTSKISTSNDKNSTVVVDQVPKPGISLSKGSIVMMYDQNTRTSATVPDLEGKSAYQATTELRNSNLNISIEGSGTVISQDPPKGSSVDAGTVVKVTLKPASKDSH
ncbi:MAG: PASTA domain-containing protein [Clostridia bacterium]|nr:PASTA domain-containing protein [Clostridia bacterium]